MRVGQTVQAFQRATDAFDDVVAVRLGVNRTDLRCLDLLFAGPQTAGDIASAAGLSLSATTAMIDRLERRGMTRRIADPFDRRKVQVEMTEDGRALAARYYGPLAAEGSLMLERFTANELAAVQKFLEASCELTDRHRHRVRDDDPSPRKK